ncbi:MAG: prepilin-type N-terminal cleavage/methylation domain-containing protein [Rhodocyclaceae bacterium]|nr:prepilin-type N-terminal cleavage/methylation domain-containing protein [Rhodocyclaceae bacterium]
MYSTSSQNHGFTLIELLITMAIIGILAAIAIPNYNEYIMRSRISEAVTGLSDMKAKMEQYFQDNRNYVGACAANTAAPLPDNSKTKFFNFSCTLPADTSAAQTYTVTATGKNQMAGFVYTVTQNNSRTTTINGSTGLDAATGWTGSTSCWVLNKSGSC